MNSDGEGEERQVEMGARSSEPEHCEVCVANAENVFMQKLQLSTRVQSAKVFREINETYSAHAQTHTDTHKQTYTQSRLFYLCLYLVYAQIFVKISRERF